MDLISKKELLQQTGISYGQLYRWKREKLIPESWFLKRSAFTGQETFFPREQILPRIQAILENKDRYSLTELSRLLSADAVPTPLNSAALERIAEISPKLLPAIMFICEKASYALFDLALFAAISRITEMLCIPEAEYADTVKRIVSAGAQRNLDTVLTVFKVENVHHAIVSGANASLVFDSEIQSAASVSMRETAAAIQMKYHDLFPTL